MGRLRQYHSGAERQAAFRQRQEAKTRRVDRGALDGLERRLDELQAAMRAAAAVGDEIARRCGAASVETILEKLTDHFAARAREGRLALAASKQES
jgi:hypothetical protein